MTITTATVIAVHIVFTMAYTFGIASTLATTNISYAARTFQSTSVTIIAIRTF